jgi:hypothetical protein
LTTGKALVQKSHPQGGQTPAPFARKCLCKRPAGIHGCFNRLSRKMVLETDSDVVDALDCKEGTPNIVGHHIGKVRRAPTRWQLDDNGGMPIVDVDGLDKTQLQNRLVKLRIQDRL